MVTSITTNHPGSKAAKHPHAITQPPPCLSPGMRFYLWNAALAFWQMFQHPSETVYLWTYQSKGKWFSWQWFFPRHFCFLRWKLWTLVIPAVPLAVCLGSSWLPEWLIKVLLEKTSGKSRHCFQASSVSIQISPWLAGSVTLSPIVIFQQLSFSALLELLWVAA